jgi:hypothetical protein
MPFIPVPDCVQARLNWQHDSGLVAENVFYHGCSGVPTMTDLTDIGDAWSSLFTEALVTSTAPQWNLVSVTLRAMNEAEGIEINFNDGFPIAGTNPQPAFPNNVSYTITWGTGLVGRSARGRTYGIGLPVGTTVNDNRLSDATQASLQNSWDIVREGFETAAHAIQVVSFIEGGVPRAAGRALPALASAVRFPLATRRSRLS